MRILCDKPSVLKEALGEDYNVDYSPALDVYTKNNAILTTLKGLYVSSKLDFTDNTLIEFIKEKAKPAVNIEPFCHTCYNYEDFDNFCREYLDNQEELRVAYDVETTAAPFLSDRYKLAGFSLANSVEHGCYVVLESIDYTNPDIDKCLERLRNVIKSHRMLVFNSQHEYIATKICLDTNLQKESLELDDAYAYALTLKTESFKAEVFKLKLLCHRLLGTDNWASIIDDYIELAMDIASDEPYDFSEGLNSTSKEKLLALCDMIEEYGYTDSDAIDFVKKIQSTYPEWKEQGTIPYTLIPSRMIMRYGCYDSCYLIKLFEFFEDWADELEDKLKNSLNKPNIKLAYKECVESQIMSAILTMNGIFISEERDEECRLKTITEVEKYYNRLWDVKSDTTGKYILREFVKNDKNQRPKLEKNYLLPKYLLQLIPDGFEFISTTSSFYSFTVRKKTCELDDWIESEGLKPVKASEPNVYKILQKHLKPFSELDDEDALLDTVLDEYLEDVKAKDGTLMKTAFKPMSSPDALYKILTKDLGYAKFISRVILYEHSNLPDKDKSSIITNFLDEHLLYDFDSDTQLYVNMANTIKEKVLTYLKGQYSYKEIWDKLISGGIQSFSSPIIAYIYNVFTATGCSVDNPKYSAFDFICRLKICRKYLRINTTFIAGSSGGYASQKYIRNSSIDGDHLKLESDSAIMDENKILKEQPEDTSRVIFGSWYANCADTGRWQATVHNIPAGAYCKRRLVSRFKGGFILANDMSQAEVRELAAVSHCKGLLDTVKDPTIDIHKRTASLAFDVPYEEVTGDLRKQTKSGIFSIVYGRNEQSLATELFKGDHKAAKRLMDSIFKVYPEIPVYLENAFDDVKKNGYLVTRRGCPIFINPYTQEAKGKDIEAVKRTCYNYGIQGGASAWCTGTLVNIQKLLDKYNLKSKIICYIHDSVELDIAPDEFDTVFTIMNYAFNQLATKRYNVPTSSDTVIGVSMGEELDIKRLDKNHYEIKGNATDIEDVLNQFRINYDVEIIKDEIGETKDQSNDTSWIFIPRSELKWYDEMTPRTTEFKIK